MCLLNVCMYTHIHSDGTSKLTEMGTKIEANWNRQRIGQRYNDNEDEWNVIANEISAIFPLSVFIAEEYV